MKTENRRTGTEGFATAASRYLRFEPRRYLYDTESLRERARSDAEELDELAHARDWQAVYDAATRMKSRGESRLQQLLRGRTVLNGMGQAAGELRAYLSLRDRGEPGGREGVAAELRRLVEDGGPPAVAESTVRESVLAESSLSDTDVDVPDGTGYAAYADLLRYQRDLAGWHAVSGYVVRAEVTLYAVVEETTPVEYSPAVLAAIEDEIERVRTGAMDLLRDVYGALAGEEWERLEGHARRAASYPDEVVHDLYAVARTLREGRRFEAETEGGAAGQAAAFARAEMELNRTLRLLGVLLGAGHRFRSVARQAGMDEESREAAEAAREKGFESLVADGVNVDVGDLFDGGGEYDGRLVEVEGFAENVRFDDEQVVTRFDLVDRLHDRRVPVYYPYHDLTDWHLRDDAYVRMEGHFDARSESTGGPELQVDVVSVAENGEDSWFDAVVSDLASANVFDLYPSQGNLFWSFEPPADGGHDHGHGGGHGHADDGGHDHGHDGGEH